jgi:hypothetical protein
MASTSARKGKGSLDLGVFHITHDAMMELDAKLARHHRAFDIVALIGAILSLLTMVAAASQMTVAELRTFLPFS